MKTRDMNNKNNDCDCGLVVEYDAFLNNLKTLVLEGETLRAILLLVDKQLPTLDYQRPGGPKSEH